MHGLTTVTWSNVVTCNKNSKKPNDATERERQADARAHANPRRYDQHDIQNVHACVVTELSAHCVCCETQ